MIYPVIVLITMAVVMGVMFVFVLPKMMSIYQDFGASLPMSTKVLIAVSQLASHYWEVFLIVLVGLAVLLKILARKPAFRGYYDRFLFKLPIVGKLRREVILVEFTRTLGLLVKSGVLVVEAMRIVRKSLGSSIYAEAVKQAESEVEKGLSLAEALDETGVFPPLLPRMVAVGEETGKIDEVLAKISSYFEEQANSSVKGLTTALEPLIMIVLGVGVGFLAIAILMPIYNLTSQF